MPARRKYYARYWAADGKTLLLGGRTFGRSIGFDTKEEADSFLWAAIRLNKHTKVSGCVTAYLLGEADERVPVPVSEDTSG